MAKSTAPAAVARARAAFLDLLNDASISDLRRARLFGQLVGELNGFILEIRARLPEPPEREFDFPRI